LLRGKVGRRRRQMIIREVVVVKSRRTGRKADQGESIALVSSNGTSE
jgi:hypothetical protein